MKISPRLRHALPILSGTLLLGLAACNSQPENIVVGPPDDMKDQLANAKPVELPPAVIASKSYRCKDNSVVYLDFYSDEKSAGYHPKKGAPAIVMKAPAAGETMVADGGYSLDGSAKASTITFAAPGKPKQACDA